MKFVFFLFGMLFTLNTFSQTPNEQARAKAKEAIKLMDNGEIDKSITLLEECQKIDPKDFIYSYEIAYAHMQKKDYEKAIAILNKTKKYQNINSQVYQMSGNCYSYLNQPEKAIKEYDAGLKIFPNSGNLHLEKGNVFLIQKKYDEAYSNYIKGVESDPMYSSNYYRLAQLLSDSNQKLSGLIYGEIFMNLERTTKRTLEVSKLLYKTYQDAITITNDSTKIDFCQIIITTNELENGKFKMPFCGIFGKNFMLAMTNEKEINLKSLAKMRSAFLQYYFKEDYKDYPNVLFDYHKKLQDHNLMESYTYYLLQMGNPEEFKKWQEQNQKQFQTFKDWYTDPENYLTITQTNAYLPD
ncbi:tetratricopeptide repeat protein [Flavobacterium cerinum]|uniref:Tetratricopeptide repeat protein n=1 Tax=Flavobacterium cerinum TaxID=2502784 RepID=A0ABY5IMI1_9FLAO|nr:tetratricopeptide repeat protein [Flavobacterium cerinum]UUC44041.1 tetratricopeptide repeat protein [Flavobacterium cerinum]